MNLDRAVFKETQIYMPRPVIINMETLAENLMMLKVETLDDLLAFFDCVRTRR